MTIIQTFFTTFEGLLDSYEHIADLFKWLSLLGLGMYGAKRIKVSSSKNRFDFLKDLKGDFLSPGLMKKRNEVAKFWSREMFALVSEPKVGSINCIELSDITSDKKTLLNYIENNLGLRVDTEISEEFLKENSEIIAKTEDILNTYEHLGKLFEGKIISKKDVRLFFYTMVGDTFVVCLPYILYRRKFKSEYAHKTQKLIETLPMISGDLTVV